MSIQEKQDEDQSELQNKLLNDEQHEGRCEEPEPKNQLPSQ